MYNVGDVVPDITVQDDGKDVKLSDYRGQKVALYFYPMDDTPVCTKQACSLRDGYQELTDNNIKVLGISVDDADSHQKFAAKYNLPFTLLSDTKHELSDAFGLYGEHEFDGKKYMWARRVTYLIDEQGKIVSIISDVDAENHADQIIASF